MSHAVAVIPTTFNIRSADAFLAGGNSFLGGVSCPVKYGFQGAIPALMSRRLLSFSGIKEKLGKIR
jgi:hypothetical protein